MKSRLSTKKSSLTIDCSSNFKKSGLSYGLVQQTSHEAMIILKDIYEGCTYLILSLNDSAEGIDS